MKKILYSLFFLTVIYPLAAGSDNLLNGLDAYTRSDWKAAITSFEQALRSTPAEKKESLYWLVMAHTSAHNYHLALGYADAFLSAYPDDEYSPEVLYQKGRILHLYDQYPRSNDILYRFLKGTPAHPKVPSAYYWIGENLYAEHKLIHAREMFFRITIDYPESGKAQSAQKRIEEIDSIQEQAAIAQQESANSAPLSVSAADETENNEALHNKIETLEYKVDQLNEAFSRLSQTQETTADELDAKIKQKEIAVLKEKARILEDLYEKRVKGEKKYEE
ncbi:MAG: outer membrane protein assembly factor BamD [Treponema sp.]